MSSAVLARHFAEGYDVGVIGAILPALSTDTVWQLTPIELGAIGSYTVIGMLIGGILAGTLSELYGRKPLFIASIALFSLCMIASATAPTPLIFGISRFVAGIGLGGIIPVAAALTVEYSPLQRRASITVSCIRATRWDCWPQPCADGLFWLNMAGGS